jgi:MazG family protein
LTGVSSKAPALMEAHQLSTKAARVGFDWKAVDDIFDKLQEEIEELRSAIKDHSHAHVQEEIGDLLFAATNIARHMQVEPEAALKLTNRKFRQRFEYIENTLHARGQAFDQTSIDELEKLWQEAKKK